MGPFGRSRNDACGFGYSRLAKGFPFCRGVDSVSAALIHVPVLFFKRSPSIAAFEEGAECGARQLASRWSAGRRRAPRKGPRPGTLHPPRSALGSRNLGADRPIARPVRGASQPPRRLPALQPLFSRGRKNMSPRGGDRMRANPGPEISKSRGGEALAECRV